MSIYHVPFEGYFILTTVTSNGEDVALWLYNLGRIYSGQQHIIVGLDCEWKPNFTRGGTINRAAILQLCVDTKCLIIQLLHLNHLPQSLWEFLRDHNCIFVGVEVHRDIAKLNAEYGLNFGRGFDVRDMSLMPSMFDRNQNPGLKELAFAVVGLTMPKPQYVRLSDWQERWLSWDQIKHASVDAFASFKIGNWLINGV